MEAVLGAPTNEHDRVDHVLLAAVRADTVDFLITEDRGLRRKATRLQLDNRVANIGEALEIVRGLFDTKPRPPPAVTATRAHAIDTSDPILESLRNDYPDFDAWLQKCKREHRQTWLIPASAPYAAALAIVKKEEPAEFGLRGKVLKLCTLKVSEAHSGLRFGELLLKTVFEYAWQNKYDFIYLTVFENHGGLITLLEDFGFQEQPPKTRLGELVLVKRITFGAADLAAHDPLQFNIRYGPHGLKLDGTAAFAVPIEPRYHKLLFPEAEAQLQLMPGTHPFGNSIRKAYLCHAATRQLSPGALLYFYRSEDVQGFSCVGVVEATLASRSPRKIARFVGKRTVYSFREIEGMCNHEVLAILFRQARILEPPIPLKDLQDNSVLLSPPRSIVRIPREGAAWLHARLGE
ncbi:MAG: GNAT family N-acetyltransferase [Chloroflexi bacterium]|nr:GNAT family N-acetyltransferase [Chloroflexota bacterium]